MVSHVCSWANGWPHARRAWSSANDSCCAQFKLILLCAWTGLRLKWCRIVIRTRATSTTLRTAVSDVRTGFQCPIEYKISFFFSIHSFLVGFRCEKLYSHQCPDGRLSTDHAKRSHPFILCRTNVSGWPNHSCAAILWNYRPAKLSGQYEWHDSLRPWR